MALALALKEYGIESVSLNWSVLNSADSELRRVALIPDFERVTMLVGCGYPREDTCVPVSTRYSVDHFITYHD